MEPSYTKLIIYVAIIGVLEENKSPRALACFVSDWISREAASFLW